MKITMMMMMDESLGLVSYEVTSSVAPSNSSFTGQSSWSPSTSTSVSDAFSMFSVTSADFPIRVWFTVCCFDSCCCWTSDCPVGGMICCLIGTPASSNAFFFRVVRICELQTVGTVQSRSDSGWRRNWGMTVVSMACLWNLHRPTLDVVAYFVQVFAEGLHRVTEHLNFVVSPFTTHQGRTGNYESSVRPAVMVLQIPPRQSRWYREYFICRS